MKWSAAALAGALLLVAAPEGGAKPRWSLAQARTALTRADFFVTDLQQADQPDYELTFTRASARALRPTGKRFVFAGVAHDRLTDEAVRVRFTFVRPARHAAPESTLVLTKAVQRWLRTSSAPGLVLATQKLGSTERDP